MNFTISRDELLNTLSKVSKGIASKSTPLPILQTIKIDAFDSYIVFTASNRDIAIEVIQTKKINVRLSGSLCIRGSYLIEIVKKLDSGDIEFIQVDQTNLIIKTQNSEFKLKGNSVDEYIDITYVEQKNPIIIDNIDFRQLINQTLYASAPEDSSKNIFKGVSFMAEEQILNITATDGFRVSRKKIYLEKPYNFSLVIPASSLKELQKIVEVDDKDVEMFISGQNDKVLFKIDNILFQTRLLEGIYPSVDAVIPKKFQLEIPFNRLELLSAVDKVSIMEEQNKEQSFINILLRETNIVEIRSRNELIGAAQVLITPQSNIIGNIDNFEVYINSKNLIEALKTFVSQDVYLKFTGLHTSFMIAGDEDKDLIAIMLPIKYNK